MRHQVAFTLGSRRIASLAREVTPLAFSLADILAGRMPPCPRDGIADGLRVLSAPAALVEQIRDQFPGWLQGARDDYQRCYIAMDGSFADYMARFSGKTRATLRRKRRRFEDAGGGLLDLRAYRTPDECLAFLDLALPLSRRTYQARLLDAGLPEDAQSQADLVALATRDRLRAFLLFLNGEAVAYLCLPVVGDTLVYAHLGYDPDHAALSPGTVLQLAALEALFAEGRYRYFDFTEGAGAHKALFATDGVACSSFLLLRPTLANRALLAAVAGFDTGVARARTLAARTGAEALVRRRLRT